MGSDVADTILQNMTVYDKYALAATCTQIRVDLAEFFDAWDLVIAKSIASHVDADHPKRSFHMEVYDSDKLSSDSYRWPTSTMKVAPLMTLKYNEDGGCHAYEHGAMRQMKGTYELREFEDTTYLSKIHGKKKKILRAHPIISSATFGVLNTLKNLRTTKVSWKIHPDKEAPGDGYLLGEPIVYKNNVVYVRMHTLVSAEVCTVNPRVELELMGTSMLDRHHYERGPKIKGARSHINMTQLRLYIKKAVVSPAMKKRARGALVMQM